MVERVVVDASAMIALVRREAGAGAVGAALRARPAVELVGPDHLWLEVVNVLIRRHRFDVEDVVEAIREIDELDVTAVEIDRPLLLHTVDQMIRQGLNAYDAAYLALAEAVDGRLLTLDERLAEAAGERALPLEGAGPTRLAERRAPDRPGPGLGAVPGFGAYLAELRRRADASA